MAVPLSSECLASVRKRTVALQTALSGAESVAGPHSPQSFMLTLPGSSMMQVLAPLFSPAEEAIRESAKANDRVMKSAQMNLLRPTAFIRGAAAFFVVPKSATPLRAWRLRRPHPTRVRCVSSALPAGRKRP